MKRIRSLNRLHSPAVVQVDQDRRTEIGGRRSIISKHQQSETECMRIPHGAGTEFYECEIFGVRGKPVIRDQGSSQGAAKHSSAVRRLCR